jgi:hypothetical protein
MFKCIAAFFAAFTSVFTSVKIIASVGEDYATLFKLESDFQLKLKRDTLDKQIALAYATEATPYVAEA